MANLTRGLCAFASLTLLGVAGAVNAEQLKVLHPQGSAHGFVDIETMDGLRIGVGDLLQRAHGSLVSSRLILRFFDGSVDDETTIYSQANVFRFISDHHVQSGPSFPTPVNVTIDAAKRLVSIVDRTGKVKQSHINIPLDAYNGLASTMLMNLPAGKSDLRIATVIAAAKPRIIHLAMKNVGEAPFTLGGVKRKAIDYQVHVELGGVVGVIAPIVGKEPPDFHVLILGGEDPAFIREEGPLYVGGPIWRIQQISAEFGK
jgi:hypothetical protein